MRSTIEIDDRTVLRLQKEFPNDIRKCSLCGKDSPFIDW